MALKEKLQILEDENQRLLRLTKDPRKQIENE